jgi:hypothetical protein
MTEKVSLLAASVFRKYPGQWQVFMEDEANPGRFNLIAEQATRPVGESLEDILMRPSLADDAGACPHAPSL